MNPIVKTRYGEVRGVVADGVNAFKGIRYAAPPFGTNRFRPPQPVVPWTGVKDALIYGPKSPQVPYPPQIASFIPELTESNKDCLTLNIWSATLGSAKQPVMVWIPGGMFEFHATGASPWYDGSSFARDGVVCVTINYRVGADGFLYLGDGIANLGLLDQVAALTWVRDNIAAFGGDPGNVTIFGESAGAMSVGTLLSMPCSEGLFRRAIAQSGAALIKSCPPRPPSESHSISPQSLESRQPARRSQQFLLIRCFRPRRNWTPNSLRIPTQSCGAMRFRPA